MNDDHPRFESTARPQAHRARAGAQASASARAARRLWWPLLIVSLLTACGGGDSGGGAIAAPATPTPLPPAPSGNLDSAFGDGGKVTTDFNGRDDQAYAVAIQSDGKLVVAGYAGSAGSRDDFALARYDETGALDPSFGSGGRLTTAISAQTDIATALAVQPDRKLVAAGYADNGTNDFALVRYDEAGGIDTSFGGNGVVTTDFNGGPDVGAALALDVDDTLQAVNRIVMAGYSHNGSGGGNFDFAVASYDANGAPDAAFAGGRVTTDFGGDFDAATSVAIQADGKIVAAGVARIAGDTDFALARYLANGDLDTSFGAGGKLTTDIDASFDTINAIAVQADRKIVAAGSASLSGGQTVMVLVRYEENGDLDTGFGNGGKVITDIGGVYDSISTVRVLADDKIVVAGTSVGSVSADLAIVRYHANGTIDTDFGTDGVAVFDFNGAEEAATALGIQADGKIAAAGFIIDPAREDFLLVRVHP